MNTFNNYAQVSNQAGVQHVAGNIVYQVAAPQETQTVPSPCDNIPFRRNVDFVDRDNVLEEITAKCSAPAGRVALVGLGGIGKTQLAIEYCFRTREASQSTWVFWVYANTPARFEQGYHAIADKLRLPNRHNQQANVLTLVYDWLCDPSNGIWLMVLDNVDHTDIFSTPYSPETSQILSTFVPKCAHGSILITSRSQDAAVRLVGHYRDIIKVNPMDQGTAISLLQNKLGHLFDAEHAPALADALDFIPLALVQASAYIHRMAPRTSAAKYLQNLRKSAKNRASLLEYDGGEPQRENHVSNSIIVTWQISFDAIRQRNQAAANLLSVMSFFDRERIPDLVLRTYWKHIQYRQRASAGTSTQGDHEGMTDGIGSADTSEDDGDLDFENDIAILRDYSFIAVKSDTTMFEMHALVQFAMRRWLYANNELETWKEQYIAALDLVVPAQKSKRDWTLCRALIPHVETMLEHRPKNDAKALLLWTSVMHRTGRCALELHRFEAAEKMLRLAVDVRTRQKGHDDCDTRASICVLARILVCAGKRIEALDLFRHLSKA